MKASIYIFSLCFLGLLPQIVYPQENWELKKNKNDIKVFTRLSSDKKFKEVKVITELPGTSKQLINTILDVENHKTWVYGVKQARMIKRNSNFLIYYCEYNLTFPLQNRDMVLEVKVSDDPETQKSFLKINSISDENSEKKNIVRIAKLSASWEIFPLSDKIMKVTYFLSVDPAGDISPSVYNFFASEGPYSSFMKLKKILQK